MKRARALTASALGASFVALAVALLPAAAASAHDYLVGSDPTAGAVVTQPLHEVTLTFNDRVLDLSGNGSSSLVTVTGPDGADRHFETGCATTADTMVSAPVALGGAGKYTITYQVVSADGHTVSNSLAFTYRPPAGTAAASGSGTSTCGAKSTAPADARPTQTAGKASPLKPANSSGNLGLVIGIGGGIVLLAIAGVVVVLLTARPKPPADD
jgi:hypothetical protein